MVQINETVTSERTLTRKLAILRSASRAFGERGYHETGMRDIAADLGMTVGNLYYYFENKQALLYFCQDTTLNGLLELTEWVRENADGAAHRLYALIVGHVLCVNEGVRGSLAHHEVEALDAPLRQKIMEKRRAYDEAVREMIREGIREGAFVETDDRLASLAILGAVNWTVKWFDDQAGLSAREIGERFAAQLVRGLLRPGVCFEAPGIPVPVFAGP